jgi:hypothetical protein
MVEAHIPMMAANSPQGGAGWWPDADMLPLGELSSSYVVTIHNSVW